MHSQPTNIGLSMWLKHKKGAYSPLDIGNSTPFQASVGLRDSPNQVKSRTVHPHPCHFLQLHQKAQVAEVVPETRHRRPLHFRGE
jgi:hypothetical protein